MKANSILRQEAREALSGKWNVLAVYTLLFLACASAVGYIPYLGFLLSILVIPVQWCYQVMFLKVWRREPAELKDLYDFRGTYPRVLITLLLMNIYIFLWSLLLIVPGIIKSFSYALTPYILLEHPELENNAAIERSMAMMEGHKMRLFLLYLSFIGWGILATLTFGIGFFWLLPYMHTSMVGFYEDVKAAYNGSNVGYDKNESAC